MKISIWRQNILKVEDTVLTRSSEPMYVQAVIQEAKPTLRRTLDRELGVWTIFLGAVISDCMAVGSYCHPPQENYVKRDLAFTLHPLWETLEDQGYSVEARLNPPHTNPIGLWLVLTGMPKAVFQTEEPEQAFAPH